MARRDPWAMLYASLIFGGIFVPYYYLGLLLAAGLFLHLPLHFGAMGLFLLVASTVLLLGVFIARTQIEQRLRQRLGRFLQPLLALLLILAAVDLVLTRGAAMNPFPFAPPSGIWANFIEITAISAVVAAIVVVVRPASRLERYITNRLDRANPWHQAYRGAGYIALLSGFLFAAYWLNQHNLYLRYCTTSVEQQDRIDCQPL